MTVTLPIEDPMPIESLPPEPANMDQLREVDMQSLTHQIIVQVMVDDFPSVAGLGIESYVSRLSRIIYTTGHQVFWLDRNIPGYTVAALEPLETQVIDDGSLELTISWLKGTAAAERAEEMRRWIPLGKMHSAE